MKTATFAKSEIVLIPFKNLFISPINVRKVSPEKSDDAKLLASIATQGVIQNIVVIQSEAAEGMYEVIAGGRRYGAVAVLVEQNKLNDDFLIPASIKDKSVATNISLAENLCRAEMHPADVFMAYKQLKDEGKSEKEIAKAYGDSATDVKKLLKLARVSPELVSLYRKGEMDLDLVMAFTVCDDQEKQLACWNELSRGYIDARAVRKFLLNSTVTIANSITKFVTLKAYKAAGGEVSVDLFETTTYILNKELLEELATKKLSVAAKPIKTEGWKWVDVSLEGAHSFYNYSRLSAERVGVPTDLQTEYDKIQADLQAIYDNDEDWTDEDHEKETQLEELIESLDAQLDHYLQFTDTQKSSAGCIVTFDHAGEIMFARGIMTAEDQAALRKAKQMDSTATGTLGGSVAQPVAKESQALVSDMNNYYCQAMQAELINHDDLAYDLMVFTLASKIVDGNNWWDRMLDIDFTTKHFTGIGIDNTVAAEALLKAESELNKSWSDYELQNDRFIKFRALSKKEKSKILTFCIARSLNASPNKEEGSGFTVVKSASNFDLLAYWKPTAENYFSRIDKASIMTIGSSVSTEAFTKNHEKAKKSELAIVVEKMPELNGWLPAYLI